MKKLIELPDSVVKKLERMAKKERMMFKPFAEKVLIDYSKFNINPVKTRTQVLLDNVASTTTLK